MRGSPMRITSRMKKYGIIPAHAGLTLSVWIVNRAVRDHPRACGAHGESFALNTSMRGSSPRMRGSLILPVDCVGRSGIVPAHAGLTSSTMCRRIWCRDHPRACGAHLQAHEVHENDTGSSPRMRGSQPCLLGFAGPAGIIPAHAGLTGAPYR